MQLRGTASFISTQTISESFKPSEVLLVGPKNQKWAGIPLDEGSSGLDSSWFLIRNDRDWNGGRLFHICTYVHQLQRAVMDFIRTLPICWGKTSPRIWDTFHTKVPMERPCLMHMESLSIQSLYSHKCPRSLHCLLDGQAFQYLREGLGKLPYQSSIAP